jgi:hypothetical protein
MFSFLREELANSGETTLAVSHQQRNVASPKRSTTCSKTLAASMSIKRVSTTWRVLSAYPWRGAINRTMGKYQVLWS